MFFAKAPQQDFQEKTLSKLVLRIIINFKFKISNKTLSKTKIGKVLIYYVLTFFLPNIVS